MTAHEPRDPKRIRPLLEQLEAVWRQCPDLRLIQLLTAAVGQQRNLGTNPLFYIEDTEILEALQKYRFTYVHPPKR